MTIPNLAARIKTDFLGWAPKIPWNLALGILTESTWPYHDVQCPNAPI